ncbi:regulator of chromosome condensation 1/beta-lactamase-inhibitor protein II [Sparassis latifolia]
MTLLHAHFHFRNQQAFQRLLDGGNRGQSAAQAQGLSSSGGKSWNRPSPLSSPPSCDVNSRDWLGRTVLHLAATAQDVSATEYVRLLLAHPDININLQDTESHWTALHRALYHGNLASAVLLLQRSEIDVSVKDLEGYTAFDLYNSTLEGTKPCTNDVCDADLFTWGANRNAALGLGDGDDRTYPEQVVIRPADPVSEKEIIDARFSPIHVRQIVMSKLHTGVVTEESRSNVRLCGFGSGGRLGPGQHTQYNLMPLPQFSYAVVSVALAQDHTLALTKSGEVLSWGLNRFSQLGYVVEAPAGSRSDEPIQATARKVSGALKNKVVEGIAACKTASACWTDREVFTWGTNNGQLGYDKSAHPVQIVPRVVTKVTQPVVSLIITDTVLACLLETRDVVCIWNDGHFKMNFPAYSFPSEIAVYRPPQATNSADIEKIASCDNALAALSTNGELFTFTVPSPSAAGSSGKPWSLPQPQRVWALRKQFSAVKDVALGSDGSIIICTESGHVFVRSRNLKAVQTAPVKTFKFQRMPFMQRIISVCANSTGAYGALRVDYEPEPIKVVGNLIAQDLAEIQPYLRSFPLKSERDGCLRRRSPSTASPPVGSPQGGSPVSGDIESDDEGEDVAVQKDIVQLRSLCTLLAHDKEIRAGEGRELFQGRLAHGADIMVHLPSGFSFPAHRLILAARCPILAEVLLGRQAVQDRQSGISVKMSASRTPSLSKISFAGCQPMTVLILVSYLYSDEVLALWDIRVGPAISLLGSLKIKPAQVKAELQVLAHILELPLLARAIEPPVKRTPIPSMADDMARLFEASQTRGALGEGRRTTSNPLVPDVILQFGDKEVRCHSVILRARSSFFATFFDDEDWTAKRWTAEGIVVVNLKHMKWRAVEPVVRFLCCGGDEELFSVLETVHSVDELLEYMFDVMAAANELLLDRLVLLCSAVILKRVNISNVCYILADATHYHAMSLAQSLHGYMAANMETLLESRMLDDLTPDLIRQLSVSVRQQQAQKYPMSRSNELVDKAMESYGDWLALQDVPQPIIPTHRAGTFRDSPKLSPPGSTKRNRGQGHIVSPPSSPTIRPQISRSSLNAAPDGGVFMMDDPISAPPVQPRPPVDASKVGGWKTVSLAPR